MSKITVKIKSSNESAISVEISTSWTILQLKTEISNKVSTPETALKLIFAGRVLKDQDLVSDYKILDGNTIHLVKSPAQAAQSPASTPAPAVQRASVEPTQGQNTDTFAGTGMGQNPFAALGGMGPMGLPPMDPQLMNTLMSNPQFMNQMTSMLSNPQVMESLLSSPQFANLPVQQREMMRGMFSNPAFLQSMLPMMMSMSGMGGNPMGSPMSGTPMPTNPMANMGGMGGMGSPAMNSPSGMPPLPMPMMNPFMNQFMNPQTQSNVPPEERFATQLVQLQEMGFFDASENIRALTMTNGNVEAAVEWLFSHPPGSL
jgi:ubiquilin